MYRKSFILLLLLLFTLSIVGEVSAQGSNAIALALKVKGGVKLTRAGKTTKLSFGTPLNHGDVVSTGKDGFVTIMFTDDKSLIKIKEYSEVTVEGNRDASTGSIAKRVSMDVGELFAKVEKQRGTLEVATPTSVASVKGTEFWVVVDENGNTHVTTLEGLVALLNRLNGQVVEVREAQRGEVDDKGQMVVNDVPKDQLPQDPDPEPEQQGGQDQGQTKYLEIEVEDDDGNTRVIRIEYQDKGN